MIVYFGGHARNKTIGNSIFEKALPTLPDYQTDTIEFDSSVDKDDIAIYMDSANNLYFDFGETAGVNQIGVIDQANATVENVVAGDYVLTSSAINQLIQDMTAYATENGLTINYVEDVKANADLMNLVNSAWTAVA